MGQRHQVYVVLPYEFDQETNEGKSKRVKSNVVALHFGWLYGVSAGQRLEQFLKFVEKMNEDKYSLFQNDLRSNEVSHLVKHLYSLNIEEGTFNQVLIEPNDVATNPLFGDNNDGITIIDCRNIKPKYAMMFINGHDEERIPMIPMSAIDYMLHYYGYEQAQSDYWKQNKESFDEMHLKAVDLGRRLESYEVLTDQEIRKIFPKMYQV